MMLDFHSLSEVFPQMLADEYDAFLADIQANGQQEPIVIFQGKVLDGRHRYRALSESNLPIQTRQFEGDETAALMYVWSTNFFRRHLNTAQKAAIGVAIKEKLQEVVKPGNPNRAEDGSFTNSTNICRIGEDEKDNHGTIKVASETVGVSRETIRKAEIVKDRAPDLFESLQAGEITVEKAVQIVHARANAEKREELKAIAPPTGKYRCIVIDPPWPMAKIQRDERPLQPDTLDYPVMTLEEIQALPIPALAFEDGCHVYLWVTQKYLPAGLALFEAWGVKYECLQTWVKPSGMTPYSWMYNTEHVLFGRIGSLPLEKLGIKLSFDAPVVRHSEKPETFFDRVLEASPAPRLELFARKKRACFETWGNEL